MSIRPFALLLAILPMVLLAGCGPQTPSPPSVGTLQVRVSVIVAVRGAQVLPQTPQVAVAYPVTITRTLTSGTPYTLTARTDESGTARFELLQQGRYTLKVGSPNPPVILITPKTGPASANVQPGGVTSVEEIVEAGCPTCQ